MKLSNQNEVDLIDVAPLVLFPIFAGVVFGVWTLSINLFGTWSPSDTLFSAAGVDWSYGLIISMASILAIIGTNQIDESDYETWEFAVIAFAFFAVPLYQFVPAVQNLMNGNDAILFGVWMLTAFAAAYVAYTE